MNPSAYKKNPKWLFLLIAVLTLNLLSGNFLITQAYAGHTDALLLSCMDYRLVDDTEKYMSGRGMQEKYDHIVLAGASLGALTDQYPSWNQTFWEHLGIAIKLHDIHTVILMDHRDCGAYKVILGEEHTKSADIEKAAHALELKTLKDEILKKYPKLKVEMLLMSVDGKVESVS
jgi:carbonic anhydrase